MKITERIREILDPPVRFEIDGFELGEFVELNIKYERSDLNLKGRIIHISDQHIMGYTDDGIAFNLKKTDPPKRRI